MQAKIRAAIAGGTALLLLILGASDLSARALAACASVVLAAALVALAVVELVELGRAAFKLEAD